MSHIVFASCHYDQFILHHSHYHAQLQCLSIPPPYYTTTHYPPILHCCMMLYQSVYNSQVTYPTNVPHQRTPPMINSIYRRHNPFINWLEVDTPSRVGWDDSMRMKTRYRYIVYRILRSVVCQIAKETRGGPRVRGWIFYCITSPSHGDEVDAYHLCWLIEA